MFHLSDFNNKKPPYLKIPGGRTGGMGWKRLIGEKEDLCNAFNSKDLKINSFDHCCVCVGIYSCIFNFSLYKL